MNVPIGFGFLNFGDTMLGVFFWQWINQSYTIQIALNNYYKNVNNNQVWLRFVVVFVAYWIFPLQNSVTCRENVLCFPLGLFFVLVFLAFLYFFLAREMCFVPISFFTILHFPPRATCGQGKCKIVKNKIGARKTYKNAKNTKTKNNMSLKFNKHRFPDTISNFYIVNIQRVCTQVRL